MTNVGLRGHLFVQPIDLTDADATTVQVGGPYDTRGGKALALLVQLVGGAAQDVFEVFVLTRPSGMPWQISPGIYFSGTPTLDREVGVTAGNGTPIYNYFHTTGLHDLSIVACIPLGASPGTATINTDFADPQANIKLDSFFVGDLGNAFSVQFIDPGGADHQLEFTSDDGYAFKIILDTDAEGVITTTAGRFINTFGGFIGSSFWCIVPDLLGDGTGLLEATDVLHLSGASSDATGVTYRVRGSL